MKDLKDAQDQYVVECAAELFMQHGIDGVKMVDIARAAGVGVATVYRHFSTKVHVASLAAELLWEKFNERLHELVESDWFLQLNGLGRLQALLEGYCDAYSEQRSFVKFIDEFDRLILAGELSEEELEQYGRQIDSFYVIFEDAYAMGRQDGSIRRGIDFRRFYVALAHALMGVAQKLGRGEIIPSDDFSCGVEELRGIVNMALWSLVGDEPIPEVPANARTRG
jgi:AcrR family transcriptional regulator